MSVPISRDAGQYGQLKHRLGADHPDAIEAEERLKTTRLVVAAEKIFGSPTLSPERIERIAAALRGEM